MPFTATPVPSLLPAILRPEAGGLQIQSFPGLQSEFKAYKRIRQVLATYGNPISNKKGLGI